LASEVTAMETDPVGDEATERGTRADAPATLPAGIVSFVFTDIEGSTRLFRRLGDRYVEVLERHHELLRSAWERYGGVEVKTEGDAFFVAFADAAAAIDACAEAQRCLSDEPWATGDEPRVRMGVHSGLAYPSGHDYVAYAVHQAARVVATGHGGQVVISADAAASAGGGARTKLRSLGRYRVRDFDEPVELFQAASADPSATFPPLRAVPAEGHNLVRPRTAFLGRHDDLAELDAVVRAGALVTVVGPGGVGKTRLVVEWGLTAAPRWPDGIWKVDLGPIRDDLGIVASLANALGGSVRHGDEPLEPVLTALRGRSPVIILDNCEHLIDNVAAIVDELHAHCTELAVLATSREPLAVSGEIVFRLAPLDSDSVATELFQERARTATRSFALDGDGEAAVRDLCRRLDGLPLAIELAAAQTSMLSPAQILQSLGDVELQLRSRARGLPDRHRTMDATLAWSWQLLDAGERAALARLSVFVDGFDRPAADAAVAWGDLEGADVTELLLSLIDKSLVVVDAANSHRSRLLETVRSYAGRELRSAGDLRNVAVAVCDDYLDRFGPQRDERDVAAISTARQERENVVALLDMLSDLDVERAQMMACCLVNSLRFVDVHRARSLAASALQRLATPSAGRLALLAFATAIAMDASDKTAVRALLDEARELEAAIGGGPMWVENLIGQQRAILATLDGEPQEAIDIAQAMLLRASTVRGRTRALNARLLAEMELGLLEEARTTSDECIALTRVTNDPQTLVVELSNAAEVAFRAGDYATAADRQRSSLTLALQLGDRLCTAFAAVLAARLAATTGNWTAAVELQSRADALLAQIGSELYPTDRAMSDELLREGAARLTPDEWAAHVAATDDIDIVRLAEMAGAIFDALL
jgi:predicted ATPase/class 3 adenylate cyclase